MEPTSHGIIFWLIIGGIAGALAGRIVELGLDFASRLIEPQPLPPVIRQLILESDLVTILPLVVVQGEISAGLLRVLPFDDQIVFPIHLPERQMRDPSPAREPQLYPEEPDAVRVRVFSALWPITIAQ